MKKTLILPLMLLTFSFYACNKETVSSQKNTNEAIAADNSSATGKIRNPGATVFATCGTWHVTSFTQDGIDQTQDLSQLNLIFCPDYTFAVSNNIMAQNGKWFFGSLNDNTTYLHMDFNNPENPWNMLQASWRVNTLESSMIMLQTDDGSRTLTLQRPTK